MEFSVKSGNPEKQQSACIVVGIFESQQLSSAAKQLDKIANGYLSDLLKRGDLEGKAGQTLLLHNVPNLTAERVLLVGCGKEEELTESQYKNIIRKTISALSSTGATDASCFLTSLKIKDRDYYWNLRQAVESTQEELYTFEQFKSTKSETRRLLNQITFMLPARTELSLGETAITQGLAIATGVKVCKDLGNMPPNVANPAYLASQARQLADEHPFITSKIVGEQEMQELGMKSYLAVGQGSRNESMMSIITYQGNPNKKAKPIVLIGKGLTFDSGGISIKPSASMDEMKYDMCGAASVFGTMKALAELNLPINVIGILAGCENMPDGSAYRPGDIITTMSGQTVEVLNTDAEGRMVLCDVLTYVERFDPELVIDVATLTGACIVALSHHYSGLVSNQDSLANDILKASEQSGDKAWRLPMSEEFQEQIKSPFADMANIGGPGGGTITAACFLSRFAKKYHWAHLDVAGTAFKGGAAKGSTGRPVPLLVQFLLNQVE